MQIIIKNIKSDNVNPDDINIYCGRGIYPGFYNPKLGNPFPLNTRTESLKKFEEFLNSKESLYYKDRIKNIVKVIKNRNLVKNISLWCWCSPKKCHCDYIKILMENYINESV